MEAFLLIGGNLGDRLLWMQKATLEIADRAGRITGISGVYESPAWGFRHENNFLNQVIVLETSLEAEELLKVLLKIETELGRERNDSGYSARNIDIDILFYGELVLESEFLILPHPKIHERRFTLEPLAELVPLMIHPVLNRSVGQMLLECRDTGWVERYSQLSRGEMSEKISL